MGKLAAKKLSASTLLEVLISMVIIMIVFTLAIGIYSRITTSGFSLHDKQVQQEMQKIISQVIESGNWEDKSFQHDQVNYSIKVSNYGNYTDLFVVEVNAVNNAKRIGSLSEVIKKPDDEN